MAIYEELFLSSFLNASSKVRSTSSYGNLYLRIFK